MNSLCYFNGVFKNYDDIFVHVSDLSIHRAYAVFDFMQNIEGKIPFMDDYLQRFYNSAEQLHLTVPLQAEEIKQIIYHLVKENHFALAGIKLMLTGGYSPDAFTPGQPNFMILHQPFTRPDEKLYQEGAVLISHNYKREIPEAKTIDYIAGISVLDKIISAQAADVLFVNGNTIYECSRCNIFIVKDNTIITPASDILPGITRKYVIHTAKQFYPLTERHISFTELIEADECFITSTTKGILPVIKIDNTLIGNGIPGQITKHLRINFSSLLVMNS